SSLKQRVQHVEAGLVGGEPRALALHSAERANGDVPVGFAAPRTAPALEAQQLFGSFLDESLDGILITQPVSARNRVVGMLVERVAGLDDTRSASLGGNRMAPHRVNLRNHRYIEFGIEFGDSYRGSEARTATSDQENVVVRYVHNKHRNLW